MGKVYAYAKLNRAGLGNLLLPWARCEIFARDHDLSMLAPRWIQPKIGPVLRGENDKRYYVGLFDNSRYVRGLRKLIILMRSSKFREERGLATVREMASAGRGSVVILFEGLDGFFEPLLPHRDFLKRRLTEIMAEPLRVKLASAPEDFEIGVHLRRGDKETARFGEVYTGNPHLTFCDEWYVRCIASLRHALGYPAKVKIFTDAHEDQLTRLLSLGNISVADRNPSLLDIMILSKSKILITTGTSTFSMWAAFLGQMPSIWYPGTMVRLIPERPSLEVEADLSGDLPDRFKAILGSKQDLPV